MADVRLARNDGFGCLTIESEICAIGHPTRGGGIGLSTEALEGGLRLALFLGRQQDFSSGFDDGRLKGSDEKMRYDSPNAIPDCPLVARSIASVNLSDPPARYCC
jgi:hypothetical protein